MFVNTLRLYIGLEFSLRLEKNFDARLIGRVPIYMVHIGRIYLVIRIPNKAEVSIWGVEMFYIQVSFGPQKITVECKLWCQSSYHMYVASRHWTTDTCCLKDGLHLTAHLVRMDSFDSILSVNSTIICLDIVEESGWYLLRLLISVSMIRWNIIGQVCIGR